MFVLSEEDEYLPFKGSNSDQCLLCPVGTHSFEGAATCTTCEGKGEYRPGKIYPSHITLLYY